MSLGVLPSDASAQNIGTQDEINEILVRNQISTEFQYADIPSWSIKPKGVFEYFIFDYSKSAFEPKDPIFLSKIDRFLNRVSVIAGVNQIKIEFFSTFAIKQEKVAVKPILLNAVRQPLGKSFKKTVGFSDTKNINIPYLYGTPSYGLETDRVMVKNLFATIFPDFEVRNTGSGNQVEGFGIDYSATILPKQNFDLKNSKINEKLLSFFKKSFDGSSAAVIRFQIFRRDLENFNATYPPRLFTLRMSRLEMDAAKNAKRNPIFDVIDGRFGLPTRQINASYKKDISSSIWKLLLQLKVEFYSCDQLLCGTLKTPPTDFWEKWSKLSAQQFPEFKATPTAKDALRREYCGPQGANFQIQTFRSSSNVDTTTHVIVLPAFACPSK